MCKLILLGRFQRAWLKGALSFGVTVVMRIISWRVDNISKNFPRIASALAALPRVRAMLEKNKIFTRSGKSRGIVKKMSGNFGHLTHVRELSGNFVMSCQGIVREFCHDIIFRLKLPSYDKGSIWVVFM